jgi:hypothetical protein
MGPPPLRCEIVAASFSKQTQAQARLALLKDINNLESAL